MVQNLVDTLRACEPGERKDVGEDLYLRYGYSPYYWNSKTSVASLPGKIISLPFEVVLCVRERIFLSHKN